MSTFGREADNYARKVREIRKKAEKAASGYMEAWQTPDGVCIAKRGKVIHLSDKEAKHIAEVIVGG
jgi:hypothetical protein